MTARLRRQDRLHAEKKSRWKTLVLGGLLAVGGLGLLIFCLIFRPWKVECLTNLHTYCPESVQSSLSVFSQTPFWRASSHYERLETEILLSNPSVAGVEFRRTWLGTLEATVTEAEVLFPVRWRTLDYAVRSNGALTPTSAPSIPVLLIEEEGVLSEDPLQIHYDAPQLQALSTLYQRLQTFTPAIQKIVVKNANEVIVSPEGYGPIYMRLGTQEEMERQLNTLQAFFHSTTIEKTYQTLDIRFRDVIMK